MSILFGLPTEVLLDIICRLRPNALLHFTRVNKQALELTNESLKHIVLNLDKRQSAAAVWTRDFRKLSGEFQTAIAYTSAVLPCPNVSGGTLKNAEVYTLTAKMYQDAGSGGLEWMYMLPEVQAAASNAGLPKFGEDGVIQQFKRAKKGAFQDLLAQAPSELVPKLIDNGWDINCPMRWWGSVLQLASRRDEFRLVQQLLERGADPNAQGGEYGGALQVASALGHVKVVQLLLDKGADINAKGGEHGNALQVAIQEGEAKVARVLLERGADLNAQEGGYGGALQVASSLGHVKVVQLLLDKGIGFDAEGGKYGNALRAAIQKDHAEVVQVLLERGADPNTEEEKYGNILQMASGLGHAKVVQVLLDQGANLNAKGGKYGNALQAAIQKGGNDVQRMLMDAGADDSLLEYNLQWEFEFLVVRFARGEPLAEILGDGVTHGNISRIDLNHPGSEESISLEFQAPRIVKVAVNPTYDEGKYIEQALFRVQKKVTTGHFLQYMEQEIKKGKLDASNREDFNELVVKSLFEDGWIEDNATSTWLSLSNRARIQTVHDLFQYIYYFPIRYVDRFDEFWVASSRVRKP